MRSVNEESRLIDRLKCNDQNNKWEDPSLDNSPNKDNNLFWNFYVSVKWTCIFEEREIFVEEEERIDRNLVSAFSLEFQNTLGNLPASLSTLVKLKQCLNEVFFPFKNSPC